MTHLYELTEQTQELKALAENTDDESFAQAIADTFEALEGEFKDKAVGIVHVQRIIEQDTDAIDAEIKRLQARKKTFANRKEGLKHYLRTNMEASGITKIECPLFTISIIKGRPVVEIDDQDKIPSDFMKYETIESPMKKEILEALKEDPDSVPGCRLGTTKPSISIR